MEDFSLYSKLFHSAINWFIWYCFNWLPQKTIPSVVKLTVRKSTQVFTLNFLLLSFISLFYYNLLTHAKLPLPLYYLPTIQFFLFRPIFIQLYFSYSHLFLPLTSISALQGLKHLWVSEDCNLKNCRPMSASAHTVVETMSTHDTIYKRWIITMNNTTST